MGSTIDSRSHSAGGCGVPPPRAASSRPGPTAAEAPASEREWQLAQPPAEWLRESIVDPNAVLAPGYRRNLMPEDYGQRLDAREVDQLVDYLLRVGRR